MGYEILTDGTNDDGRHGKRGWDRVLLYTQTYADYWFGL
jgi:hypothetical protein